MEIKKGTMRTCILIGRYAIKIPRTKSLKVFVRGLLSNQDELYKWKTFKDLKKELLCPIKRSFFGGLIVIYSRTKPVSKGAYGRDVFQAIFESTTSLDNKIENFGWLPFKRKRGSFIEKGNLLVIIDYGNPRDMILRDEK